MKTILALSAALAACGAAAHASPFAAFDASDVMLQNASLRGDPTGDAFFFAPGLGGLGGYAVAGTFVDAIAGTTMQIGTDLNGGIVTVSSTITSNGGGNYDIVLSMTTTSGELAPTGYNVGGITADTLGVFLGGNANGDPFEFGGPAFVNSATIELLDGGALAAGPFDISSFANFTAGEGGSWDGGFGVTFGAGSAGAGVDGITFRGNFTVVPAPAGVAMLGLGGLVATRRRR